MPNRNEMTEEEIEQGVVNETDEQHILDKTGMLDDEPPPVEDEPVPDEEQKEVLETPESDESKPTEPVTEEVTEEHKTPSSVEELWEQSGLAKQYPGGVEELIGTIPETNKYITTIQQERAQLKRENDAYKAQGTGQQPTLTNDDVVEDPLKAIDTLFESKVSGLRQEIEDREVNRFIDSTPDIRNPAILMEMENIAIKYPELEAMPRSKSLPMAYSLAKAARMPGIIKSAADQARTIPPDKGRAISETNGQSQLSRNQKPDYRTMTLKEIEKELGYAPD